MGFLLSFTYIESAKHCTLTYSFNKKPSVSSMLLKGNIFLNQDVHASLCKNVQQLME